MPQMGQASWVARLSSFEFKYQLGLINYLELVYKHPKDFRKICHPEQSAQLELTHLHPPLPPRRGSTENLLISAWDRVIGLV